MAITVQLKHGGLSRSRDFKSLLAVLVKKHRGKWVAILSTGEVVAEEKFETVQAEATGKSARIVFMFHAPRKGELLLR